MARRRPRTPTPATPPPEPRVTVTVTPEAGEQVERLPEEIQNRFWEIVERLRQWPAVSGVKRLKGELAGWCRVRTGDYRVRFRVQGNRVTIDKVGHRRDVYED